MNARFKPTISAVNEDSFIIKLADEIDLSLITSIASLNQQIKHTLAEYLIDSTPSYNTILVQFNLLNVAPLVVYKQLEVLLAASQRNVRSSTVTRHRLPVYYDHSVAPDLQSLAEAKSLTVDEVIRIHCEQIYQVCALGFSPGFAFLAQVDPRIQMPRLATPRGKVNAGSVAIADKQTAVYPSDSPGGWNIIGHCPIRLFDMTKQPISDFQVGDEIEFYPVDENAYLALMEAQWGEVSKHLTSRKPFNSTINNKASNYGLEVVNSGVMSQIQDAGRFGQSEQGISQGGTVDSKSAAWANRLLGNEHHAVVIEVTIGGVELLAHGDIEMSITGADMSAQLLDDKQCFGLVHQQSFRLANGQRLKLAYAQSGARAYIAVKGGVNVASILNSVSTVSRNRLGGLHQNGQSLQKGDWLPVKQTLEQQSSRYISKRVPKQYHVRTRSIIKVALIESYQAANFSTQQKQKLYNTVYTVSTENNRMGMRLEGEPVAIGAKGVVSEGIALGSVQIPADGIPIILLQDRQTLGGYPKIGCIARNDLSLLAQLSAGAKIQFYPCSLTVAQQQYREQLQFFIER